jgi:hypothetical protein
MVDPRILLIEWRDAREAIFASEHATPKMVDRLAAAELALMNYARTISVEGAPKR